MKSTEVKYYADFFGISEDEFLKKSGLNKAISNDKLIGHDNPKSTVPPIRGIQEYSYYTTTSGVQEYGPSIPPYILRRIPQKNPVVAAGINARCMQCREFSKISTDPDEPGWRIRTIDKKSKTTQVENEQIQKLQEFFWYTGRNDFEGYEDREDNMVDIMSKICRDQLEIDRVAIEVRRNNQGKILDFWLHDGGTIRRVWQGGYGGSRKDFNPRGLILGGSTEFREQLMRAKIEILPEDLSKIKFVQIIDGQYVSAFTGKDMIFDVRQKRSDVRYWGEGYSPLEQAMWVITGFLNGLAYNSEAFNKSTIPKIALAFEDRQYTEDQLIDLQDQWLANFQGYQGVWRIPLLRGKVNSIDLYKSARDMEYMRWLEFVGALILSIMGIDGQEIGLRFQQATNVLNENPEAKMKFSKSRGLIDILTAQEGIFNKLLIMMGWANRYYFEFTGLNPEDREANERLRTQAVKHYKTVDEVRAENDLPPLPDKKGELILDTTYFQSTMQAAGAQAGGMPGMEETEEPESDEQGGSEDEFNQMLEQATDEIAEETGLEKAEKIKSKPRTLLI